MSVLSRFATCAAVLVAVFSAGLSTAYAASMCAAQSGAVAPTVVELYTSEGCSSCPPADRWFSRLKADPGVVALAFHVDYWDRLGWKDRFSSAAYTERQAQQRGPSGARFSYTPQVIVDGVDRPDWPGASLARAGRQNATLDVHMVHEANRYVATVTALPNAPGRLAAYWAVTEGPYVTTVQAGENQGATLTHDQVVRDYAPVAAWTARTTTLEFTPREAADPAHPRDVNLVLVDAATGRPIQAVKLGC